MRRLQSFYDLESNHDDALRLPAIVVADNEEGNGRDGMNSSWPKLITLALAFICGTSDWPACASDIVRVGEATGPAVMITNVLDVGIQAGIFKKYDIDAQRVDFEGAAKLAQGVTAHAVDIAMGGSTDLNYVAKGEPAKAIGIWTSGLNSFAILVRYDAPTRKIEELKGKKIGSSSPASITTWIAKRIAALEGWGPLEPAYLGGGDAMTAAVLAGTVDAVSSSLDAGYQLEAQKRLRVLVAVGDVIKGMPGNFIFASNEMLSQHPDLVRRFLRGWYESVIFARQTKNIIYVTAGKNALPPEVEEVYAKIYAKVMPDLPTDGHFAPEQIEQVEQAILDVGLLTKEQMPPTEALITQAFLP
jgi:NitT/TauT family transport system substrate-binding protein